MSDPHGDLIAFNRVIADLETNGPVDEVLLGGDLAQGGAQPVQILSRIRELGWPSVRGNADDLLVRVADGMPVEEAYGYGEATHGPAQQASMDHAQWSAGQLGGDDVEFLRSLPRAITRSWAGVQLTLVHATPWSTEDVVLPDSEEELAERVILEAGTNLVLYGHIHTQYLRRVGQASLVSVGAVYGSNDADPRPAYVIISIGQTVKIAFRRVDWPEDERRAEYQRAGVDERFIRAAPGPFPLRVTPNVAVKMWP